MNKKRHRNRTRNMKRKKEGPGGAGTFIFETCDNRAREGLLNSNNDRHFACMGS